MQEPVIVTTTSNFAVNGIYICVGSGGKPYVAIASSQALPRAHAIIDGLCTHKEKRGESLVCDAILLHEGVERGRKT